MNHDSFKNVSVCICTYKRTDLLRNCLQHILNQNTRRIKEIVIVDNDKSGSARDTINSLKEIANMKGIEILYEIETEQNISLARNRAIHKSSGAYLILIDDDEYPLRDDWIENFMKVIERDKIDGVLGPIINIYPEETPEWQRIPNLPFPGQWETGKKIEKPRGTGNIIFKRDILIKRQGPFNPDYGRTGGEDAELLQWLLDNKANLLWCDEAIVAQKIENKKLRLSYHLKRNFQFGSNCSRIFVARRSYLRALFEMPIRIFLGTFKIILFALLKIKTPKTALFYFLTEITVQAGKIGYFFGIKKLAIYK